MASENIDDLVNYCKEKGRVCPVPMKWKEVWELLPNKNRKGSSWEPSLPLILAAWYDTPAILKMIRLKEHINWAEQHGVLDEISFFLRNLSESDWFHIGD
ncbi:hypothetical protein K8S19_07045 [bacterium]|nr:hypothetical protein [bacterium]